MSDQDPATGAVGAQPDAGAGGQPSAAPSAAPPPDWTPYIPKELTGDKTLESYKGKQIPDLIKGLVESQKYAIGALKLPGKDAKPEEWGKVYDKLGRPADPTGYKHQLPELPAQASWNDEALGAFNQVAHKIGLNPAQAQELINFYGSHISKSIPDMDQQTNETIHTLKGEWGSQFEQKYALAFRGLGKVMGDALGVEEAEAFRAEMNRTRMGNSPQMLKVMAYIGEILAEKRLIAGDDVGFTEASLDEKIAQEEAHPAYHDRYHPQHQEQVDKVLRMRAEKVPFRQREEVMR